MIHHGRILSDVKEIRSPTAEIIDKSDGQSANYRNDNHSRSRKNRGGIRSPQLQTERRAGMSRISYLHLVQGFLVTGARRCGTSACSLASR
ncbi:hypothetical protein RvY_10118 [Ramazzottius varieornatus]|uniref:Uncharacterized protein n=1 Tax=Ramazzottius varieornatus TaxID=947166 RepID=A0A1D1VG83_RAMVA|nr:hypothetical protein RvY_10118 [Ramazzottius varieornatus]